MDYPVDELAARRRTHASVQTRTTMPSQQEYEAREAQEFHKQLNEVEKAPLAERKEAAQAFYEAMAHDPAVVGERVGWLIAGNYGYGSMKAAERILAMSKRANKAASLTHAVAALEWRCPIRFAMQAWKKLTPDQKRKLDSFVKAEISSAASE